jgi:GNAT superfamily N-acetyltransferase
MFIFEEGVMTYVIKQSKFTDEIKDRIHQGFNNWAISQMGVNKLAEDAIAFEMYNNSSFIGAIIVQHFWGQLYIKLLYVEQQYRGQGISIKLMNHALKYAKEQGCTFAFLETFSFQALGLYLKLGFILEYTRHGYANGVSFHYLRKDL